MEASLLTNLSPEIRNTIYEHVFTSKYAVTLRSGRVQHPLTQTCRRIRYESLAMYYALTRFNAHLDDGPATPLAEWLKTLDPNLVECVEEINIWDLHMLNGTIHGSDATQRLLKRGTEDGREYVLRPIGNWIFNRGWYMRDVILTLHSMGLGLSRFCIVDNACLEGSRIKLTSEFAIVRLDSQPDGEIFKDEFTEVNVLARQFGLSEKTREELILMLAAGSRTVKVQDGHRNIVFDFEKGGGTRLTSMRQEIVNDLDCNTPPAKIMGRG